MGVVKDGSKQRLSKGVSKSDVEGSQIQHV